MVYVRTIFLQRPRARSCWNLRQFCCPTLEGIPPPFYLIRHEPMVEEYHQFGFYCGNLRCVGLLCNSLACFARSLACFARSLADLGILLQGPRSPISKKNPSTCCLISFEVKGVMYHQAFYPIYIRILIILITH